jgi:ribonuclease HI
MVLRKETQASGYGYGVGSVSETARKEFWISFTTNNRMELLAVGLEKLKNPILIAVSDSKYVVDQY